MDDPCAYLPDNPAHADPELAAVRSVLSAYWPL
jgi:hypothetical protein